MIITVPYRTRNDGVKLVLTLDAEVNENGKVMKDGAGNPIPRGFYILQNETGFEYDEAIDVEGAPYTYSETNKPIPKVDPIDEPHSTKQEV